MNKMAFRKTIVTLCLILCASCASQPDYRFILGQKLMLDMRFYCADNTPTEQCKTPVTSLLPEFADIIRKGRIGGVILFAENLDSIEQIVELNYDLQELAKQAGLPPLFIAIDQEGGRVARLSDEIATRFVGNMAIGATFKAHDKAFATAVNDGIAKSIKLLGFNVNFAPTVDVNINPDNPVINVRSYSESAPVVASLGAAAVEALQKNNIISALKHFPGHGDTHTDSHTGLPRVEHDAATIEAVDLLPFKTAIEQTSAPAMVMTAHIQYPQLDNTRFIALDGQQTLVPATLSKKILTGLLRDKLQFTGLIVTDALDMAGIAHYVSHRDAVIKTFQAGADIALMPYAIRNPDSIKQFWSLYSQWLAAMKNGELAVSEMQASLARIANTKQQFELATYTQQSKQTRVEVAQASLPMSTNKQIEKELASAALTRVFDNGVLPLSGQHFVLIMPDEARCLAMKTAVAAIRPELIMDCSTPSGNILKGTSPVLEGVDGVIVADISPQHSLAEMGGMADLNEWRNRPDQSSQHDFAQQLLKLAQSQNIPTVFVALRAPYVMSKFRHVADAGIATFGYNVMVTKDEQDNVQSASGAVFDVLAAGLFTPFTFSGTSPVTIE